MKKIYLDLKSGISGNMFLGALIQSGFPMEILQKELSKFNLGDYRLINEEVDKCGVRARYFDVEMPHQHHSHRHLDDIRKIIESSSLSPMIKERAMAVFTELARAEAHVHGTTIDEVHFHEVGAIDTIIDIMGVLLGLEYLGIEKIYFGEVITGSGKVLCEHGLLDVPAPATAALLEGIPNSKGDIPKELTTPTGAVLIRTLGEYAKAAPFALARAYYGAGKMDLAIPNVLKMGVE